MPGRWPTAAATTYPYAETGRRGAGSSARFWTAPAMARADNSSFLAQANARRHQAALSAARHAIQELQRQGQAVNFSTVAQSAGVSRGWLYRQDQIRDLISRQQALKPPAARRAAAQRATADSLRQRLDAARAENTRLRAENRTLREQIARHLASSAPLRPRTIMPPGAPQTTTTMTMTAKSPANPPCSGRRDSALFCASAASAPPELARHDPTPANPAARHTG